MHLFLSKRNTFSSISQLGIAIKKHPTNLYITLRKSHSCLDGQSYITKKPMNGSKITVLFEVVVLIFCYVIFLNNSSAILRKSALSKTPCRKSK